MTAGRRTGFTLVELLIAIIIFGVVSAAIMSVLVRSQRLARTQADRSVMQANIRTGMALITSELKEINITATQSDITAATATSITYRGQRGLGFICDVGSDFVRVARSTFSGYRVPEATDGLVIFVDNDVDSAADDGWMERVVTATGPEACSSGAAGIRLQFGTVIPTAPADSSVMITIGSPVRNFEEMEVGALVQGGQNYLAARSISKSQPLQPVLGPLALDGVRFDYLDGITGLPGATTLTVRAIRMTLRGITDNVVIAGAGTSAGSRATDSLITTVQLRNTP